MLHEHLTVPLFPSLFEAAALSPTILKTPATSALQKTEAKMSKQSALQIQLTGSIAKKGFSRAGITKRRDGKPATISGWGSGFSAM